MTVEMELVSVEAPERPTRTPVVILREVAATFERPALLFSGGKDSCVVLRLAEKAFKRSAGNGRSAARSKASKALRRQPGSRERRQREAGSRELAAAADAATRVRRPDRTSATT